MDYFFNKFYFWLCGNNHYKEFFDVKICVWPDYMWCEYEYLEEYNAFGDDFMIIDIPDDIEDVDEYLDRVRIQDFPISP